MLRVMVNAGGCAMKMKIRAVPSLMVIAAIVALAIGSIPAHAQTVTATIAVGSAPRAVAVNPVTNKIYVQNANSNSVTVIDGATNNTTTVPVGNTTGFTTGSTGLAIDSVTNKVFVANFNDNTVTVINGATHTTTTAPPAPRPPRVPLNPLTPQPHLP